MTDLTPLFNEIISKKAENNNGFLIVGCHGKGKPMAAIKDRLIKEGRWNAVSEIKIIKWGK